MNELLVRTFGSLLAGHRRAPSSLAFSGRFGFRRRCAPSTKSERRLHAVLITCCWLGVAIVDTSCSRSSVAGVSQPPVVRFLSPTDAAQVAARLANDECERLYKRRPFVARQYPAVLQNGEYCWGHLDEGAVGGFSASITIGRDGSNPKVQVYFSTDQL